MWKCCIQRDPASVAGGDLALAFQVRRHALPNLCHVLEHDAVFRCRSRRHLAALFGLLTAFLGRESRGLGDLGHTQFRRVIPPNSGVKDTQRNRVRNPTFWRLRGEAAP